MANDQAARQNWSSMLGKNKPGSREEVIDGTVASASREIAPWRWGKGVTQPMGEEAGKEEQGNKSIF